MLAQGMVSIPQPPVWSLDAFHTISTPHLRAPTPPIKLSCLLPIDIHPPLIPRPIKPKAPPPTLQHTPPIQLALIPRAHILDRHQLPLLLCALHPFPLNLFSTGFLPRTALLPRITQHPRLPLPRASQQVNDIQVRSQHLVRFARLRGARGFPDALQVGEQRGCGAAVVEVVEAPCGEEFVVLGT